MLIDYLNKTFESTYFIAILKKARKYNQNEILSKKQWFELFGNCVNLLELRLHEY